MINHKVLEDLLQEPLGPYRDRDILHETVCQMKGASQLVLYSFILEHDGHVIGYSYDSTYSDRLFSSNDVFFSPSASTSPSVLWRDKTIASFVSVAS